MNGVSKSKDTDHDPILSAPRGMSRARKVLIGFGVLALVYVLANVPLMIQQYEDARAFKALGGTVRPIMGFHDPIRGIPGFVFLFGTALLIDQLDKRGIPAPGWLRDTEWCGWIVGSLDGLTAGGSSADFAKAAAALDRWPKMQQVCVEISATRVLADATPMFQAMGKLPELNTVLIHLDSTAGVGTDFSSLAELRKCPVLMNLHVAGFPSSGIHGVLPDDFLLELVKIPSVRNINISGLGVDPGARAKLLAAKPGLMFTVR